MGFSIPRDSVVSYPQTYDVGGVEIPSGKIDQAYYWAYEVSEQQTSTSSMSSGQRAHLANQAGELAEVRTVEAFTGVTINHFVESNLVGFYSLAQQFGGIEVCVKPAPAQGGFAAGANLTDHDPLTGTDNSNFDAYTDGYNRAKGGAQYLHLSATQSLAFVRSRDTLPGIDIGRTHRQQAAIDYVIYELKNGDYFGDIGKLDAILSTAGNYLITDQGFNLLDFATDMQALTGKNLSLATLPGTPENDVAEPGYPTGEDIISVNVPAIQRLVKNAFYPQPAAPKALAAKGPPRRPRPPRPRRPSPWTSTTAAARGGWPGTSRGRWRRSATRPGRSPTRRLSRRPSRRGPRSSTAPGPRPTRPSSRPRWRAAARPLASLPAGQVEVLLGSTVTLVPAGLAAPGTPTASTQSTSAQVIGARSSGAGSETTAPTSSATAGRPATSSAAGSGASGDGVAVDANARYGIPCVY